MDSPAVRYYLTDSEKHLDHTVIGESDSLLLRSKTSFAAVPGAVYVAEVSPVSVSDRANATNYEYDGEWYFAAFFALCLLCCGLQVFERLLCRFDYHPTADCACCCRCCCEPCANRCVRRLCSDCCRAFCDHKTPPSLRRLTMEALPRRSRDSRALNLYLSEHLPMTVMTELVALRGPSFAVAHRDS